MPNQIQALTIAAMIAFPAAIIDLKTRRIPNPLLGWSLLFVIGWRIGCSFGQGDLTDVTLASGSLVSGGLVTAAIPTLMFARGVMGGGDVKLLAVIGATVGPIEGTAVLLWSLVLAGGFGTLVLLRRRVDRPSLTGGVPRGSERREWGRDAASWIPFGPAVFVTLVGLLVFSSGGVT